MCIKDHSTGNMLLRGPVTDDFYQIQGIFGTQSPLQMLNHALVSITSPVKVWHNYL